ncbi:transcription termination factor 2 isoform X2 [Hemiscyllium ocellatum]|uniref:transcription termination factor 2 isoform X2 n=1 Tax=Hemiscyllium ocellatum TaxID=170820 RepID=UPI0029677821|nr:transcription termination factor 2 isoform X2 [Hemiscyllium ocellatum]
MEKVLCEEHGTPCFLKTGVRDGATKGKSFYICGNRGGSPCMFTQLADIPVSHCLVHTDSVVELQAISAKSGTQSYWLYYRCVKGKADNLKWCGNIPWQEPNSTESSTHHDGELSHRHEKHNRNPFRIPSGNGSSKPFTWKAAAANSNKETSESAIDKKDNKDGDDCLKSNGLPITDKQIVKKSPDGFKIKEKSCSEARKSVTKGSEGTQHDVSHLPAYDTHTERTDSSKKEKGNHLQYIKPSSLLETDKENVLTPSPDMDKMKVQLGTEKKHVHEELSKHSPHHGDTVIKSSVLLKGKQQRDTQSSSKNGGFSCKSEKSNNTLNCCTARIPQQTKSKDNLENSPVQTQGTKAECTATADNSVLCTHSSNSNSKTNQELKSYGQIHAESPVCITAENSCSKLEQSTDGNQLVDIKQRAATEKTDLSNGQRTITAFPGFEYKSTSMETKESVALHNHLTAQLKQKKNTLRTVNVAALPDKGQRLINQVKDLEDALGALCLTPTDLNEEDDETENSHINPFDKSGTILQTKLAPHQDPPSDATTSHSNYTSSLGSSQLHSQLYGAHFQQQVLYGGRMTEERLLTVKNITSEAIEQLHRSLESCPNASEEAEDPPYLKVPLLVHQKQALAWLLWREKQKPSGGILADDMGLGKTLTMIALILAQRCNRKEEKEKKPDEWISKTEHTHVTSSGTLIICPASLIHHWKKEIERHVSVTKISIYMYHGPKREQSAKALSKFDVVVTTYSLVAKEIPVNKGNSHCATKDDATALTETKSSHSPLLKIAWSRIILDEAHNIKNPQVQTSMAVCKLQAKARWAVTGTPIQNNLLDMYSLLKFLHCSPFDEFKLWKNQVDNGTRKGGERLNIITKSLLLRRMKDQLDANGKPLVVLPQKCNHTHKLKLSEEEEAVYNVLFARSRSTLQSYLKRHEGKDDKANSSPDTDNHFSRACEFGIASVGGGPSSVQKSSQTSSTAHILSLLLRLRQCCCHLSLLKTALSQSEMESEGITLSLEEQLNALSLSEVTAFDNKPAVSLNGTSFKANLFEKTRKSTKISALLEELKAIRSSQDPQKCVIISQWTSMLKVVAGHLDQIRLSYITLDGSVTPKLRMDLVDEFNTNPKGPQVILVSLCAGGVGLNLIGGNHLFLLDMHWNPALEEQASDRIYRVGQLKNVTVHRFICEGTIEEKIFELQEKKKDLAKKVLTGTGGSFTKLTLADLRILFGV